MTTRILLADDQELVRAGFATMLRTQPDFEVVGEAGDGRTALALAFRHRPDLAILDIRMPALDGITATREICATPSLTTRVLVLTTYDLDEYVLAALRAGASGFLLKDTPREGLYAAVRTLAAGEALLAPQVTRRLIERYLRRSDPPTELVEVLSRLTERETEVLRLIAAGLSNLEIAGRLYRSEATVRTHVGHLFAKINARDRAQAVVFAYESGLVQPGSAPP